jgi:hypothetical protein
MVSSNDEKKQNVKVSGNEKSVDIKIKYYIHANCLYGIKESLIKNTFIQIK